MEEEDKHDKPKSYTFFNIRFLINEKFKTIKYAEENNLHAESNIYGIFRKAIRYWLQQNEERMEVTIKLIQSLFIMEKLLKRSHMKGKFLIMFYI